MILAFSESGRSAINFLLAVAGVIGLLLLLELATRIANPEFGPLLLPSPENCLERSPTLGYAFKRSCNGRLAGTKFRTNSHGFRGADLDDIRRPGQDRA